MAQRYQRSQQTFIAKAGRGCWANVTERFARVNRWREDATDAVGDVLDDVFDWEKEHAGGLIVGLAIVIFLALMVWFLVDVSKGKVVGNALQTGVGGIIGGAVLGAVASGLLAAVTLLAILLANKLFKVLTPVMLFLPLVIWTPIYALGEGLVVVGKLLLLAPLVVLFVITRAIQLWKGIHYQCPTRQCPYRGLPHYVCAKCATSNAQLWPNLYGLLWHECVGCGERLPTLDLLGRHKLRRRCARCDFPLTGRHAGLAPERLVAIAGGPDSGKTVYLLMAAHQILRGNGANPRGLYGELDDPAQEADFEQEDRGLRMGLTPGKTTEVLRALLLYAKVGRSRCQLYLYDAPGEEFGSVSSMTKQQYFPLLDGIILLVDPLGFASPGANRAAPGQGRLAFQEVVNSTVGWALSGAPTDADGKFKMRVAVVIAKADEPFVKAQLGDPARAQAAPSACREAIVRWGGENSLNALQNRFHAVDYFACSALGRPPNTKRGEPFNGLGVLPPLLWVLTGRRE